MDRLLELSPAMVSPPTRRSILRGIMVFRWLSAVWAVGVFLYELYDRNVRTGAVKLEVARPYEGIALFGCLFLFLLLLTASYRSDPDSVLAPRWILGEISLATVFLLADIWVYGDPSHAQALPTIWPVAPIATVALAAGTNVAVVTGFGLGAARYVGWLPYGDSPWSITRTSSLVLFMIAGWSAGHLFKRLELADVEISGFRAREEVARTLHDGVLQTLAVIQRRSTDRELVAMARRQELDLRDYLFAGSQVGQDLAAELRLTARAAEERHGFAAAVVCAPDLPSGSESTTRVLIGAVTEALNNVGKHADATEVTIYAEPDFADEDLVFVSVKDNGVGFDPEAVRYGRGIERSIRARLAEAGGRSEIASRSNRGTEVKLWL
ncbi:MAG: sensor histidine kinase [Acidimicrobiales bacterium]